MEKYKILVVDDEEDICEILKFNLENTGYLVDTALSAEEALFKMKTDYHLILLDIMMDGISGLKLAQLLREDYNNHTPIIFISALDTESDILNGFNKGGDDYISKPFSIKQVLARVKAVLNRYTATLDSQNINNTQNNSSIKDINSANTVDIEDKATNYSYQQLKVDFIDKRVYIGGQEIILTKKESEILVLLTKYIGKIFSRDDILKKVWKDESYVLERTVDVHIARLRKKLGKYGDFIINRSGYGYCFNTQD